MYTINKNSTLSKHTYIIHSLTTKYILTGRIQQRMNGWMDNKKNPSNKRQNYWTRNIANVNLFKIDKRNRFITFVHIFSTSQHLSLLLVRLLFILLNKLPYTFLFVNFQRWFFFQFDFYSCMIVVSIHSPKKDSRIISKRNIFEIFMWNFFQIKSLTSNLHEQKKPVQCDSMMNANNIGNSNRIRPRIHF